MKFGRLTTILAAGIAVLAFAPASASASGGSITGTYWIESPVAPVFCGGSAAIFDANGNQVGSEGFFPGTGIHDPYLFGGLEDGDYRVGFEFHCMGELDWGLKFDDSGFYRHGNSLADATPVRVTDGSTRTGINRVYGGGASISGKVTDSSGEPLGGICVLSYDPEGNVGVVDHTGTDGRYELDQLLPGDFRLGFSECLNSNSAVIPEFYGDKETLDESEPVSVETESQKITGIDAQLTVKDVTPPGEEARISKVTAKGPARTRKGQKATFRVGITNSGDADATGVRLKVKGKGVSSGAPVGEIPAGATKAVRVKLNPTKPGKTKLTFKVTSSNGGDRSVERRINVRRR